MTYKIQLITYPPIISKNFTEITLSLFNEFYSLDSFDYNFINLNTNKIQHYYESSNTFSKENDFQSLKINFENSNNCKIIVILPQNLKDERYGEIKNNLNKVYTHIYKFYPLIKFKLIFGKNITTLHEKEFQSDFYLSDLPENCDIITKNINDNVTTIEHENIIYTTLDFKNDEDLVIFINFYEEFIGEDIEIPNWFNEINMFDDLDQKQLIEDNNNKINELKVENEQTQEKLDKNNEYKSILYKQGKPLENAVRQILEELLDCNLSDFEDIGHEDFLIEFDDVTFIGEIKGVNRNITNVHLSKLDNHLTRRQDNFRDENLQPILIANRFIKRPPVEREPINHDQIDFAENKYKCLIIDSLDLLILLEKFKNGEIESQEIKNRFTNEIGLFKN